MRLNDSLQLIVELLLGNPLVMTNTAWMLVSFASDVAALAHLSQLG